MCAYVRRIQLSGKCAIGKGSGQASTALGDITGLVIADDIEDALLHVSDGLRVLDKRGTRPIFTSCKYCWPGTTKFYPTDIVFLGKYTNVGRCVIVRSIVHCEKK